MNKLIVGMACAMLAGIAAASAQSYPSKPVTIVIPLAAGGAVDTMVRTMLESLRASLGQPILVENIGGAGGTTGITRVARAAPDGYTISVGTWGTHVLNAFIYSPPYDLATDFETVALLPSVPHWFIAQEKSAAFEPARAGRLHEGQQGHGRIGRGRRQLRDLQLLFRQGHRHNRDSSCPIAAALRLCRISSPATSTRCAISRRIRSRRSRPATSRPMR